MHSYHFRRTIIIEILQHIYDTLSTKTKHYRLHKKYKLLQGCYMGLAEYVYQINCNSGYYVILDYL